MKDNFMKTDIMTVEKKCKQCGKKYTVTGNLQSVTKKKICLLCVRKNSRVHSKRHAENNKEYYKKKNHDYYLKRNQIRSRIKKIDVQIKKNTEKLNKTVEHVNKSIDKEFDLARKNNALRKEKKELIIRKYEL